MRARERAGGMAINGDDDKAMDEDELKGEAVDIPCCICYESRIIIYEVQK